MAARPAVPPGPPGTPQLLLTLLCWALASGCMGAMALEPPKITLLQVPADLPPLGESLTLRCEARSRLPELALLYWLGNGSFVERLPPDAAATEGTVLEEPWGSGVTLRRDLHLGSFGPRHLRTNFTCVLLTPLGADTREVLWPPTPTPTPLPSGRGLRPGSNS